MFLETVHIEHGVRGALWASGPRTWSQVPYRVRMQEEEVHQHLSYMVPWPLLLGMQLNQGLGCGGGGDSLELPPGLADVIHYTSCNDNPGNVDLSYCEVSSESAPASLQVAKGIIHQCAALAQVPVEMCLAWGKLASVGLHEPGQEWLGRLPDEEEWDGYVAQLQVQNTWLKAPALHQGWKGNSGRLRYCGHCQPSQC